MLTLNTPNLGPMDLKLVPNVSFGLSPLQLGLLCPSSEKHNPKNCMLARVSIKTWGISLLHAFIDQRYSLDIYVGMGREEILWRQQNTTLNPRSWLQPVKHGHSSIWNISLSKMLLKLNTSTTWG